LKKVILPLIVLLFFVGINLSFAEKICVSTYNVENLFDDIHQGTEYREFVPSKYGWSKEEAEHKFQNTLRVLKDLDSDIFVLQEVENEELMVRLKNDIGFKFHAFSKNDKAPIGVGVISKYPIIEQNSYTLKGYEKFRPILQVKVDINKTALSVWANHWPSLSNDEKTRVAFAKSLKHYIQKAKDNYFLALGDFNTHLEPNSVVEENFSNFMYDPWSEMSKSKRWNYVYKGERNALDRILISNSLIKKDGFSYIKGSFQPFKRDYLLNSRGQPKGNFRGYSDHLPLSACFKTK
jgi:exonuclease III